MIRFAEKSLARAAVTILLFFSLLPKNEQGLAREEKPLLQINFIYNLSGEIPFSLSNQTTFPIFLRLSKLKDWKKNYDSRVIIDFGDNHYPGILGKFSLGLITGEIFKELGVSFSMLGKHELQIDMESMKNLVYKTQIKLLGANLAYNQNDSSPFIKDSIAYAGKGSGQIAIIFLYGEKLFLDALPGKWPIVTRTSFQKKAIFDYLETNLERLKSFRGPILLLSKGMGAMAEEILEKYARINGIVIAPRDAEQNHLSSFRNYAKAYSRNQQIFYAIPWQEGVLRLNVYGSGEIQAKHIPKPKDLPKSVDTDILSKVRSWSNLYLEQKNITFARLSRPLLPSEINLFFGRIVQDYFGVEWVGFPSDTFLSIGIPGELDQFFLDEAIARQELFYKFFVKGKTLQNLMDRFGTPLNFWRGPGDPKIAANAIDPAINYSVVIPSSIYFQAFWANILPEPDFQIKTWKNSEETVQAYFKENKWESQPPFLAVNQHIGPNPMWRFHWKLENEVSWQKVDVRNNGLQASRPDFVTATLSSISLGSALKFFLYNINHRFTEMNEVNYSKIDKKVGDNKLKFTFQYDNLSFFLEPYLRTSVETLVDYQGVREFYEVRPWVFTQALGFSVPIWLTKHRLGLRMEERERHSEIKPKYGFEYFIDFSQLFMKIFTYIFTVENYLSYQNGQDFKKYGIDQRIENKLKIQLIEGLGITLSHKYLLYKGQEIENEEQKMENNNYKAMLTFEKTFR